MVFHSRTSDRRVQCFRVGLEVKIYDTPAGGIRASKGTFSSSIGPTLKKLGHLRFCFISMVF